MEGLKRAAWETLKTALVYTVFCLFAMAILAAIVTACAPPGAVTTTASWALKCVGSFIFSLIFIRRGRAFFKGIAAGICGSLFSVLAFAAIGGGFFLSAFYPLELLACALFGGAGALLGTKLRKE